MLAARTDFLRRGGARHECEARLAALALGVALGAIAIVTGYRDGMDQLVAEKMHLPTIHIEFPPSVLIYPGAAIIVEVITGCC